MKQYKSRLITVYSYFFLTKNEAEYYSGGSTLFHQQEVS